MKTYPISIRSINPTRIRTSAALVAWLTIAALLPDLSAQHAETVLFSEPNAKAQQVPDEQRFVHPVSAPYFHEDSFVTTDLRPWFVYHDFPNSSLIDGGKAEVYAVQLRAALTDSLQFVAYKDGYTRFESGLVDESGFNNLAAGIKWNFLQDWEHQWHAATGVGYELKTGDGDVLQNYDELRVWGSVNKGFDRLHLGGTVNFFVGSDTDARLGHSDRLSWHLHVDYYCCNWFSPVLEMNGYHVINEGNEVLPFQGVDVTNLGGGKGEEVVTLAPGIELRPVERLAVRAAYEFPLTQNEDLFGYRWTLSTVFSF